VTIVPTKVVEPPKKVEEPPKKVEKPKEPEGPSTYIEELQVYV
jgi:hypothetical protein